MTTRILRDGKGSVTSVDDGRGSSSIAYNRSGFPVAAKNPLGMSAEICYNNCNVPVRVSDVDGVVTEYTYNDFGLVERVARRGGAEVLSSLSVSYDAAGRLVREGSKTYRYGYLDKVMSVTDNGSTYTYDYHADGQLARANYGSVGSRVPRDRGFAPTSEDFLWDGLALIQRGDEQFINEPHIGGGNPVASSKGTSYFNDALGTTVGAKKDGKYSPAALTAFGENLGNDSTDSQSPISDSQFFTGKPFVPGLGHAFLMRNYRAGLAKWQTADPMGYPDGWNRLAYCNNGVTGAVDLWGCVEIIEEGKGHILKDRSWAGWKNDKVYKTVGESGADGAGVNLSETAFFQVFAQGTCNHRFDSLEIVDCALYLESGSRTYLNNCEYDGHVGSFVFTYSIVGTPKSYVVRSKYKKIVRVDITASLQLTFEYTGADGVAQQVIVKNSAHVFHLQCEAVKE